jgi:predicted dehydrogenase
MEKIRWGILGTGNIARSFATGVSTVDDAEVLAVGSRSQATADAFGDEFNVPRRYPTYEALVADPDIDAVYVSSPHTQHKDNSLLCIEAGKAVLCEKPFTINAAEAEAIINRAREKNVFVMEAMWTRFLPVIARVRQLVAEGALGDIRLVTADFGFRAQFDPQHRLFNPELGGGALLDVGIYPISLASMVLGQPERISSLAHLGDSAVDELAGIVFSYPGGKMAVISASIAVATPIRALIAGTEGHIEIEPPFFFTTSFTLSLKGRDPEIVQIPYEGNGYPHEIKEVGACLRAGKLQSDIMPLDETLAIMRTMDSIREQWGLRYPSEA